MKSSFHRDWSYDTLSFIFGTNTLTGPHDITTVCSMVLKHGGEDLTSIDLMGHGER